MSEQLLYVDDVVRLRSNEWRVGLVEITCSNIESHSPDPQASYGNGIGRGGRISNASFQTFLRTGIPPRGTVLVTWAQLPWQINEESILIQETDLDLVDRLLLLGDIVKKSARDTESATVIQASTRVTLLQSLKWREAQEAHNAGVWNMGAFPVQPINLLRDIPSNDLRDVRDFDTNDFIIKEDWVGRFDQGHEETHLRLSDNSVVVPLYSSDDFDSRDGVSVGELIRSTKSNLRRGRYIYGSYNARVEPEGFVADIRPAAIEVDWISSRFPTGGGPVSEEPDLDLDPHDVEIGDATVYNRRNRKGCGLEPQSLKINWELEPGDNVRFQDIAAASVKYDGSNGKHGKLNRILRSEALGYDVNVFKVVSCETMLDIQWQNGTITRESPAKTLIPFDIMDAQEELWPGELVWNAVRADSCLESKRVGIVQTVNARDRMVTVKWIPGASLTTTLDDEPTLLPGSRTGIASGESEHISLYDIEFPKTVQRRRGDFVVCVAPPAEPSSYSDPKSLWDLNRILGEPTSAKSWFGEIIDLGLDGLLTIRLAAADPVRDARVPWECTHLVWSSDDADAADTDSDEDTEMGSVLESEGEEIDPVDMGLFGRAGQRLNNLLDGLDRAVRRPRDAQATAGEDEQDSSEADSWETEEECSEDSDVSDEEMEDAKDVESIAGHEGDVIMDSISDTAADTKTDGSTNEPGFVPSPRASYAEMFAAASAESSWYPERPEPFKILDGSSPADHHWHNETTTLSGKGLRRIQKEHRILSQSLPDGAYVRTWEGSLDCMRILLLGPIDTPYEYAPFVFDLLLGPTFPSEAPQLFFHSWTQGHGPCNPNLYEDGKVCLSLLGTWPSDEKGESWTTESTILQLIVSLLGLVLVPEPYYNEAGYEVRKGSVEYEVPSALYNERVFLRTRYFIDHALMRSIPGLKVEIAALYYMGPKLLLRAIVDAERLVERSLQQSRQEDPASYSSRTVSVGAVMPLQRQIAGLKAIHTRSLF